MYSYIYIYISIRVHEKFSSSAVFRFQTTQRFSSFPSPGDDLQYLAGAQFVLSHPVVQPPSMQSSAREQVTHASLNTWYNCLFVQLSRTNNTARNSMNVQRVHVCVCVCLYTM